MPLKKETKPSNIARLQEMLTYIDQPVHKFLNNLFYYVDPLWG